MSFASDKAVGTFRATAGFTQTILACSSYAQGERLRRRWIKYPIEVLKRYLSSKVNNVATKETPFLAAASISSGLSGQIQGAANQLLASVGHNVWYPKTPGQRGLRILCLDGGGTRGITAISSMKSIGKVAHLLSNYHNIEISNSPNLLDIHSKCNWGRGSLRRI